MATDPRIISLLDYGIPAQIGQTIASAGNPLPAIKTGLALDQLASENAYRKAQLQNAGLEKQIRLGELAAQQQGDPLKQQKAELEASLPYFGAMGNETTREGFNRWLGAMEQNPLTRGVATRLRPMLDSTPDALLPQFGKQLLSMTPEGRKAGADLAFAKPEKATGFEAELLAAGLKPGTPEWNAAWSQRIQKQTTVAPPTTNISINTGKKYGEAMAGKVAERDIAWQDSAIKAPDIIGRAQRVKQILTSGQVFTGAGAEWKLQFGKAAKTAGLDFAGDAIANTERLAADLGQGTLDAIKLSGLGAGQGFTNTDREFLERVVTGKVTFDAKTLMRTAELAEKAARLNAQRWNERAKNIPREAVEGVGLDISPVPLPAEGSAGGGVKFLGFEEK